MEKPTLYTYCLAYDSGVAPNPYGGVCTLGICKPKIRSTAAIGDWIVGTSPASANKEPRTLQILRQKLPTLAAKIFGSKTRLLYAMKVTDKKTFKDYDVYCKEHLPAKIPDTTSTNYEKRYGDCVYDFSDGHAIQRKNPNHNEKHQKTDLGGNYVLLSDRYYYFGTTEIHIPEHLEGMIKVGPGHRAGSNDAYLDPFLQWIEELEKTYGVGVHGDPLQKEENEAKFKKGNA
jgi:hypothetical protein